jgi:RNA polymerase sigma-70 factor (ECF subfamily)
MVRPFPVEGRAATDADVSAEARLVGRARSGDGQAFASLVKPHLELLYRIAARAAGSRSLAEDAVQETLELVHRRLGRYEAGTSFRSFIAAIAVRRARTLLRAEIRRARRESVASDGEAPASPEGWVAAEETATRIRAALGRLPAKRQQVVLLRLDAGLGYAEIAAAVGTTEGSARVLVHHALRELKSELKDMAGPGDSPPGSTNEE